MFVSFTVFEKAPAPIYTVPAGITIVVIDFAPLKAPPAISTTVEGTLYLLFTSSFLARNATSLVLVELNNTPKSLSLDSTI